MFYTLHDGIKDSYKQTKRQIDKSRNLKQHNKIN